MELGFWIPVLVGFRILGALFQIPQAKIFPDSGFHKENFNSRIPKSGFPYYGTRHETETLEGQQLEGRKTEAMFTLRTAFRIGTKSFPVGS